MVSAPGRDDEARRHAETTFLKADRRKIKGRVRRVSRAEYRLHRFRKKLDKEIEKLSIHLSNQEALNKIKEEIDVHETNFLRIVSLKDGLLPEALDQENIPYKRVDQLVKDARTALLGLFSSLQKLSRVESRLDEKVLSQIYRRRVVGKLVKEGFHIHVDGKTISMDRAREVEQKLRFYPAYFDRTKHMVHGNPPKHHFTHKFQPGAHAKYKTTWKQLEETLDKGEFSGYIEGESVYRIDFKRTAVDEQHLGFPVRTVSLVSLGEKGKEFRESELHVTMRTDSNPKVKDDFIRAGFMDVYRKKADGEYVIFTSQGKNKDIAYLAERLLPYLKQVGGIIHGKLIFFVKFLSELMKSVFSSGNSTYPSFYFSPVCF